MSSAGDYARKKLRESDGLVDSLVYLVRSAIERANIDNKSVENAVCVLRNLSYRAQEIEDPNYDKRQLPLGESRAGAKPTSDNLGCFGASKAKSNQPKSNGTTNGSSRNGSSNTGMDLLWQPEVVQPYLNLLSNCSNPETLEAAAGGIQNLSACYWQPSIDIRAAVRKEKGLPILVELLRMEVDRVVCAVATALRNLAIDQRNKELIGKTDVVRCGAVVQWYIWKINQTFERDFSIFLCLRNDQFNKSVICFTTQHLLLRASIFLSFSSPQNSRPA